MIQILANQLITIFQDLVPATMIVEMGMEEIQPIVDAAIGLGIADQVANAAMLAVPTDAPQIIIDSIENRNQIVWDLFHP